MKHCYTSSFFKQTNVIVVSSLFLNCSSACLIYQGTPHTNLAYYGMFSQSFSVLSGL